jgi:TRAP-type C4-dicarboxylate transport system permease small subunit
MPCHQTATWWSRLLHGLIWVENATLISLLGLMVVLAGTQIIFRNLLNLNLIGVDQLLRLLVLWVALLGAVAASREDKHISVDLFSRLLPARTRVAVRVILDLFTTTVCILIAWHAARFVASERAAGSMVTALIPMWIAQLILPVAFTLIALRYVLHLVKHLHEAVTDRMTAR